MFDALRKELDHLDGAEYVIDECEKIASERIQKLEEEIEACLKLIPKECVVRVREGGGPENIYASLAVSLMNLVSKL